MTPVLPKEIHVPTKDDNERFSRRRAFTLIELLVAISTIAVLVSILLPALGAARRRGQQAVCGSNLHQLAMAHQSYAADYEGTLVPVSQDNGVDDYWHNKLGPYFGKTAGRHGTINPNETSRALLRCPRDANGYPSLLNPHSLDITGWLSYAINSQRTRHMSSRERVYAGAGGNPINLIRQPSMTMLHCDFAYLVFVNDFKALATNQYSARADASFEAMDGFPEQNKAVKLAYRHDGKMNLLWVDGHVSSHGNPLPSARENRIFWGRVYEDCEVLE